jgi:co-chaperonin GroES (HSP10)
MAVKRPLTPQNDFILLEEAKYEPYAKYKGFSNIVLPDKYEHGPEDRPVMGTILAKGSECVRETIRIGSIAICGKWTGSRFYHEGVTYVLVKESDVLGILE